MTDPAPPLPAAVVAPPPAPPSSALADREFVLEVRRGFLIIARATMKRFRVTWKDFLPPGMAVIEVGE